MKRKAVILTLIAACCIVGFLLWPDPSSKVLLADGTVLVLSGLKVGRTNVYQHGTKLSKLLGRFAPTKAVKVAGITLQRPQIYAMPAPEGSEILTAELWLRPGHHFRLEERETSTNRDWREVATFVVSNPKVARVEPWIAQTQPRVKLADGLDVEVGELTVRPEPIQPTDIWEYTAFLPVRIFKNGQLATNWGIAGGTVRDASGNYDSFSYSFTKTVTNGWTMYRIHRPLDPAKVWNP